MSFHPAFLDEIRNRLPLSAYVGRKLKLTPAGREFKACCPFHNEKSASFYINDAKRFFHCFGCGAHGDIIGFAMRNDRLSFPEAIESLAGQAGLEVPRDTPQDRDRYSHEAKLYDLLERAAIWFEMQLGNPSGREAQAYIAKRGVNEATTKAFRLGYAPNDGQALVRYLTASGFSIDDMIAVGLARKSEERGEVYSFFRHRLMFPVGDRRGRIVAFGGRVLGPGEPKYLNSPEHPLFHKGKLLFGLSRAQMARGKGQPLIVVEGYMDVIALVQAGFVGAVAPLGTALTEDQLRALWSIPSPAQNDKNPAAPILCFDGDAAGQRAAARGMERALPLLTPMSTLSFALLPVGRDPDDLIREGGPQAMQSVLAQAKPMIQMIWDSTLSDRDLTTPEARGAFIGALRSQVMRIADKELQRLYGEDIRNRLAQLFERRREPQQQTYRQPFKTPFMSKNGIRMPPPPPPNLTRRQPLNAARQLEKALLALMINHPALFDEFGEDFVGIRFLHDDYEQARQAVADIISEVAALDEPVADLTLYVQENITPRLPKAVLSDVLSEMTYTFFSFTRPERSFEEARQGWLSISQKLNRQRLLADLDEARQRYNENASDENWQRILALQSACTFTPAEQAESLD